MPYTDRLDCVIDHTQEYVGRRKALSIRMRMDERMKQINYFVPTHHDRHDCIRAASRYHRRMDAQPKPERARLSAEDWELGALELIAEQGVGALAVEALARRLGVTKGSFYWHFRTRETLLQAALERWERYQEQDVLARIESITEPHQRLRELFHRVARENQPARVYAALLKALDHPLVVPLMARVSGQRVDFLTRAYREAGLAESDAVNRARLTYAAYVGFLQLNLTLGLPKLGQDAFDDYVEHTIATLVPD